MNPILHLDGLPRYQEIRPEHIGPAIDTLIARNQVALDALRHDPAPPTWNTFVQPLEDAIEAMARAWNQVAHLNAVVNTPELREAYNANLPKVTMFWAGLGQDEQLFARYRALAASPEYATLTPVQQRVIDNELRDFRLGGAELSRTETYHEGSVPLHTLRANIDYGFAEAKTVYGKLGIKCWICKGEVKKSAAPAKPADAVAPAPVK